MIPKAKDTHSTPLNLMGPILQKKGEGFIVVRMYFNLSSPQTVLASETQLAYWANEVIPYKIL